MTVEHCCYIGGGIALPKRLRCDAPAEWVLVSGPTDADVTYACTAHVGYLLTDATEQRIYPVGPVHASDCAIYNGPALLPGPCNCGATPCQPR